MVSAWNQVIGVEAANRALRLAQLAKHVGAVLHRRHLARMSDAAVVSSTERVHAKVLDAPDRSVWASIDASSLPPAVTTGAFRRLARVRGPVAKVAGAALDPAAVDSLTVAADRLTTDWVRDYVQPDGVAGLGASAKARVDAQVLARVVRGDRDAILAGWDDALAGPGPEEPLAPDALDPARFPDALDLGTELLGSLIDRLVAGLPRAEEIGEDEDAAAAAAAHAVPLRRLVALSRQLGQDRLDVPIGDAERLELPVVGLTEDGRRGVLDPDATLDWINRLLELALSVGERVVDRDELETTGALLEEQVIGHLRIGRDRLVEGLRSVASKIIFDDPYAEPDRARVDAPALELVRKLDPRTTIPARVRARLTLGSGRLPSWLRPDWFDDLRIEPVMAHPRFAHPMYEPLDRYDRDWMVPGLGLIKRPDMTTLLRTNSRFVEAYLVGLNHEMGRELLWREYPADQRGTYFSSFWTGETELVADLHELPWRAGALRSHVKPEFDGQIVLLARGDLVRRYPGVVAHAVRQAQDIDGPLFVDRVPVFEPGSLTSPRKTLFHIHLPPNLLLAGFQLTEEEIRAPGAVWWFTLSENPSEPRFGLDESRPGGIGRNDLVWSDFAVGYGEFLNANTPRPAVAFNDHLGDRLTWGTSSAQVAALLFQLPARAAFLGTRMLDGAQP